MTFTFQFRILQRPFAIYAFFVMVFACLPLLSGCAPAQGPGARNVEIPSPTSAALRPEAVNEKPDSVLYLPLGSDVLVPEAVKESPLPSEMVGPFELRSETLAGALQLILADYELPLAFETEEGLTRTITVANLRGPLNRVVERVCGLADLYCAFEDGLLVVKETQTFTVTIPPIGGAGGSVLTDLAAGVQAVTGLETITEASTRTIIYEATSRTARLAERYFQRIRANTAMIIFEIYIWEVALDTVNDMGIDWQAIEDFGKFRTGISIPGSIGEATAVSIGLPTTGTLDLDASEVLRFISDYGAVKSISQPQLTMLSGSESTLRAAQTEPFVSSLSRTVEGDEITVSTETDTVDSGFTITINCAWDNATVYGTIDIELQDFIDFSEFEAEGTTLKLPRTTERELTTQVRIRPGDSLLIAGLVRENDVLNRRGPGFNEPFFPTSRRATVGNSELVFLLKPRVVVFAADDGNFPPEAGSGMGSIPRDVLNPSGG